MVRRRCSDDAGRMGRRTVAGFSKKKKKGGRYYNEMVWGFLTLRSPTASVIRNQGIFNQMHLMQLEITTRRCHAMQLLNFKIFHNIL
ncbi:hypothetical protein DEO72_LG10g3478 [Vigna unguiculata]|uniref:Uncharacterized protein n=1 Tax=Vigna unguiculata TaxID=3917 RepID=A0A4D6NK32_VIGUN|nr:hypothetical protein DEO72_LG10g3478 [Vigna unguiculata]